MEAVRIRVTPDGKSPKYELMIDGNKARDLSWIEVLELATQATSALRYIERPSTR